VTARRPASGGEPRPPDARPSSARPRQRKATHCQPPRARDRGVEGTGSPPPRRRRSSSACSCRSAGTRPTTGRSGGSSPPSPGTTSLGQALDHLEWHPWSRAAALDAARCLGRLDFAEWAEPYYRRAGLGRLGAADLHARALGLFRANRRDRAVEAYREILARRPADILALRRLAAIRIAQGAADDALALAGRLAAIPGGEVIGHTLAGTVSHDIGRPERSVEEFSRVLTLDPGLGRMPLSPRSMFWSYLGQDLLALGRPEEARGHLERALTEGDDAGLAALLASAHRQLGDLDEAERWWRVATGWDPKLAGPWLNLGRLAIQRDRPSRAIEPLRRAAELLPDDPGPPYSLSLARRRLGETAEADRLLRQADRLRAGAGTTAGTMGQMPAAKSPTPLPSGRNLEP